MPSITRASGYWVFMHILMEQLGYQGPFKKFAEDHDSEWLYLSNEDKKVWKDKAEDIRLSAVYQKLYIPLEKKLKKNLYKESEVLVVLENRMMLIKHMIHVS